MTTLFWSRLQKLINFKDWGFGDYEDIISGVDALLENFIDAQMALNRVLATHGHPPFMAPPPAVLAMETIEEIRVQTLAKMPLRGHRMKILQMRLNQLMPFTEGWIGSKYNSTT